MKQTLFTVLGMPITAYALLTVIACAAVPAALALHFRRKQMLRVVPVYAAFAVSLSLVLGRSLYCAVHASSIFYDPMGRSLGLAPLFDLRIGSISVIGVVLGCLIAAWISARLMHTSFRALLDTQSFPLTLLFSIMRFIEPLSGQGFGPTVTSPLLTWAPLSIQNGWGGWAFSICFLEAVLLLVIAIILKRIQFHRLGSRFLLALLLITASQLIPESLRRDDALKIFTFARVNQIGFVALFFAGCVACWVRSGSERRKGSLLELMLVLLGIMLLIAGEFALDKTQWPDGLIYLAMIAILLVMLIPILRRLLRIEHAKA